MRRIPKDQNLIGLIRTAIENGQLLYSSHATTRMVQRNIIKPEIEHVLLKGFHESKKDTFNVEFGSWDYAIRGKTVDNRNLRIIIAVINPNILVVTAIALGTRK